MSIVQVHFDDSAEEIFIWAMDNPMGRTTMRNKWSNLPQEKWASKAVRLRGMFQSAETLTQITQERCTMEI
jgi:hypothetical protein